MSMSQERMGEIIDRATVEILADMKVITKLRAALEEVVGCFDAAFAEGLSERLAELPTETGSLADLVNRRLMFALFTARAALEPKT